MWLRRFALVAAVVVALLVVGWSATRERSPRISGKPVSSGAVSARVERFEISREEPAIQFRPTPTGLPAILRSLAEQLTGKGAPPRAGTRKVAPENLVYVVAQVELTGAPLPTDPKVSWIEFRLDYGDYTMGAFSNGSSVGAPTEPIRVGAVFLLHQDDPAKWQALEVRVGGEWLRFSIRH